MEAKHTPGPWELRNEFGMQGLVYPAGAESPVAAVTGYYARCKQSEPNARLIAAAPELLEALASLCIQHSEADLREDPDLHAAVKRARAAIAKATQ
ncbi:MAG: hypothetical protein F9K35_19975 [Burkholderiaceae bacterium]|nr:MAG: hypothetical protein F9K35_19975 [Burkholderiaceae bacterium]